MRPVWPGTVAMDRGRYLALAALAGVYLLDHWVDTFAASEPSGDEERAVYVVENGAGLACYAGQSRRGPQAGAAGRRVGEHMREPSKASEWARYWVFPLKADTPDAVVDTFERAVAVRLGLPLRNRRWRRRAKGRRAASPSMSMGADGAKA